MTLWSFQSPFTVAQRSIFVRIIWTLNDISAAGHIELAILRTVDFVREITTVVLLVAFKGGVDAFTVRAMERS